MAIKKIFKILGIIIVIFVLLLAAISTYFLFNARTILVSELKKNLGVEVSISDLKVILPNSIVIENFAIADAVHIEKIAVAPSFFGFLHGDIVFNSILLEKPRLTVTRLPEGVFDFGFKIPQKTENASVQQVQVQKPSGASSERPRFYFDKLKIKDATISLIDKATPSGEIFQMKLTSANLDVSRVSLLDLSRFRFDGQTVLMSLSGTGAGELKSSGWIDVLARDMDAKVEAKGMSMSFFAPYYKKYIKKEIASGDIAFLADLKSKANDLTANCHVELNKVAFKEGTQAAEPTPEIEKGQMDLTALAFDSVLSSQGAAVFDFSIRTKLDHPKFEKIRLKASFLQSNISQILNQPSQKTEEDFKNIGKQFKSIGKEFKKIFKSE